MLKTLKFSIPIGLTIIVLTGSGCSSLVESTRKSLLGSDKPRKDSSKEVKWVSKAQYDALMDRYKTLNDRYEKLKDDKIGSGQAGFDQMGEMASGGQSAPSKSETVDVFADNGLAEQASKSQASAPVEPKNLNPQEVDQELQYYKKAVALKENGKVDEALKIFQYLERSSTEQIRVRSRAQIGQIYMSKAQYDLALQVFEKIIQNDAFSSKVLEALEGAVVCSDKLQLQQKKQKYQSILRDFFEIEG